MARKRNAGEGSIFERSDGRWAGQIDLGWNNGKRQRKLVYAATASAVREKMTKLLRDRDLGTLPANGSSPTMEAFLEAWLASVKASLRVRSFERYDSIIKRHLTPIIGRIKLEKLTLAHVQSLLDVKLATGLSPRSVRAIRIVLGAALKQAVRWQMAPRNVAELANAPRLVNREMQVFSPEQARNFLAACRGEPLEGALLARAEHRA